MSTIKTNAIVLRHANYGECDRMLTLLTPEGLLSVSARGCRKATSKKLSAVELFTAGEYLLHQKGERYQLTSFQPSETYYPIREDFDRLSHGVYWLNLCEAAAQPCEDTSRLYKMLLLSLAVLAYGDLPLRPLTAVFLAQFALLSGFAPRLDACTRCGKPLERAAVRFDAAMGGICCAACAPQGKSVSPQVCAWMREALEKGAFVLAGRRPLPTAADPSDAGAAFDLFRAHVERRLDRALPAGRFL